MSLDILQRPDLIWHDSHGRVQQKQSLDHLLVGQVKYTRGRQELLDQVRLQEAGSYGIRVELSGKHTDISVKRTVLPARRPKCALTGGARIGRARRFAAESGGMSKWLACWSGVGLALMWHAAIEHGVYSFNAQERGGYE